MYSVTVTSEMDVRQKWHYLFSVVHIPFSKEDVVIKCNTISQMSIEIV